MQSSQPNHPTQSAQSDSAAFAEGRSETVQLAGEISLVCFGVAGLRYAMEIGQVREIVRRPKITPLPNAPELIEGVVELRDNVIPVIDLGHALGHPRGEESSASRVAIVEVDEMVFGLCVDSATDVLAVTPDELRDPPPLVSQAGYETVKAVVHQSGSTPVLVLSLENILESVYRSGLPRSEDG